MPIGIFETYCKRNFHFYGLVTKNKKYLHIIWTFYEIYIDIYFYYNLCPIFITVIVTYCPYDYIYLH